MTIRDESIKALEVALWGLNLDPPNVHRITREAFTASPTLAADLDLGTAWRMAQAECKRLGWVGPQFWPFLSTWRAAAHHPAPDGPESMGEGPDETAALVALTAALRDRAR